MAFDSCEYTNSKGQSVDLMSQTIRSNVVELKPFSYTNTQTISTIEEKEFEMVIIVKGKSLANETVDKLMADVIQSEFGSLTVNSWRLSCRCVGITMIDAEHDDVYRFAARFYSSYPLWTKSTQYTVTGTGTSNRVPFTVNNYWGLSSTLSSRISSTDAKFTVYDKPILTYQVYNTIIGNFATLSTEPTSWTINWPAKRVGHIELVPDDCDVFKIYPPGNYGIAINTGYSSGTFTVIELRGMPEW